MSCSGVGSNLVCRLESEEPDKPILQEVRTLVEENDDYWEKEAEGLSSQKRRIFTTVVRDQSLKILREVDRLHLLGFSRLELDKVTHREVAELSGWADSFIKAREEEKFKEEMGSIDRNLDFSPPSRHDHLADNEISSLFTDVMQSAIWKRSNLLGMASVIASNKEVVEGSESPMRDRFVSAAAQAVSPAFVVPMVVGDIASIAETYVKQLEDPSLKDPCLQALRMLELPADTISKVQHDVVKHAGVGFDAVGVTDENIGRTVTSIMERAAHLTSPVSKSVKKWGSKILDSALEAAVPSAYAAKLPSKQIRFEDLWSSYEYLARRPEWINNGCALNLSNALMRSGAPSMRGYSTAKFEDESLLFRLRDLDSYLQRNKIGSLSKPSRFEELSGKRGILYFKAHFPAATGHVTLWNESSFHPNDPYCHYADCKELFSRAEAVHFYEFPKTR